MDFKELTYIVTIADEGSISRAAEKLYMAQSSLSQFLQQYEAELGSRLFIRTARGVRLTAAGTAFLYHAKGMLQQYHRAQCELGDMESLQGGRIELGISTFRGGYLLPSILKRFRESFPHVHVEITELDSAMLEERIIGGYIDIGLVALPLTRLKHKTDFLMRDEVVLVAHKSHPVMEFIHRAPDGRPWVFFDDAAHFEFILGSPGTMLGRIARLEFRKRDLVPVAYNTNITAPLAAALACSGVALALTYQSCRMLSDEVEYLSLGQEGIFIELALAYPPDGYRSKATMALGELMHEMLK
ncbi:MAG TPA: LysR family transcriptional regulator [Clostridia bacterium]|nr:LysR family transcriptional regulator [Clostridia bacterium]